MGYSNLKEERCSNCFYNKYDGLLKRFYCGNKDSELYDSTAEYNESCEMWESNRHE